MSQFPALKPREVIRALEKAGFVVIRIKGSHHILHNATTNRTVTVPNHRRDMKMGLLKSIIRSAGFTQDDFLKLLK